MSTVTDEQIREAWKVTKPSSHALRYEVTCSVITCAGCGILFALPDTLIAARKADHLTFYCPAGHSNNFPQKTELDLLKEKHAAECQSLQRQISYEKQEYLQLVAKLKTEHAAEVERLIASRDAYRHLEIILRNKFRKKDKNLRAANAKIRQLRLKAPEGAEGENK